MNFYDMKITVEEEDVVVLYLGPSSMHSIEVKEKIMNRKGEKIENVFQTVYGALKISSLIGKKYGSKIELSRGWGYILQPTPELWTLTLPHRTQIIYTPDISLIIHLMDLSPRSVVIETGTGSGSLSHSIIRSIKPHGHLHTFDFHEARVSAAQTEFERHGLNDFVTLKQRDIYLDGFGKDLTNLVDAIFLDLPHPWLAIKHAMSTFKKSGGKLCSFSPCIEQVQKTCTALMAEGFIELNTFECLQREMNVHYKNIPVINLECLKFKERGDNCEQQSQKEDQVLEKRLSVTHADSIPGHTGFVTIATLPPLCIRKYNKHN